MSKLEPTRTYSNPTATDVLRRMLDERGVEHEDKPNFIKWDDAGQYQCFAFETFERQGLLRVHCNLTPEQAIAATLGRGTCRMEQTGHVKVVGVDYYDDDYECSECGAELFEGYKFCPMCGRRVEQ